MQIKYAKNLRQIHLLGDSMLYEECWGQAKAMKPDKLVCFFALKGGSPSGLCQKSVGFFYMPYVTQWLVTKKSIRYGSGPVFANAVYPLFLVITLREKGFAMKKGMIRKLFAASVLACAASASQAAVVENWDFALVMKWDTSKTVFEQSEFAPGTYNITSWYRDGIHRTAWLDRGQTVNTVTELSWGSNRSGARLIHPDPLYARSGLVVERPNVTGNIATSFEGQPLNVTSANMFTHYSGEISGTSDTLVRAQLDVSIQLMLPGYSDTVVNISKSFDVHFLETTNYGHTGCSYSYNCDDDVFAVVSGMDLTSVFTYGGVQYTLNYFEGTDAVKELSAPACRLMGFAAGSCYGFATPEHTKTDVMFNFTITAAAPVPEPETYAMLLAGLGMVGIVVRRRKIHN
ncbi:MAG: THxN family PEP-CTERM protein [Azoarcus sp.]|jgi:hypothetical protein|nr:THxN family PEP-CTERM protein [Azoarcus sp.]